MRKVLLFNDMNIKVKFISLFDNFEIDDIVFLFFSSLRCSCKFIFGAINNASDLLLFEYWLFQTGSLGPVLEVFEPLTLWLSIIKFDDHCSDKL